MKDPPSTQLGHVDHLCIKGIHVIRQAIAFSLVTLVHALVCMYVCEFVCTYIRVVCLRTCRSVLVSQKTVSGSQFSSSSKIELRSLGL